MEDPVRVDGEHAAPFGVGGLIHCRIGQDARHAGHEVDGAVLGLDAVEQGFDRRAV
ncbi:hypothetical protein D3C85_1903780 [compost metagenome]